MSGAAPGGIGPRDLAVRDWRRILVVGVRGTLVVLWLLWAMLAWWSAPRPADADQARRDIADGSVTSVDIGTYWNDGGFWGRKRILEGGPDGSQVAWTTETGRVRYTEVGYGYPDGTLAAPDGSIPARGRPLVAELQAAAGVNGTGVVHPLIRTAYWLAVSLMAVFLMALVSGPAPIGGTKWYWFWLSWIPFGLGVLAWVTREPWLYGPQTALAQELVGIDGPIARRRSNGFEGFALLIVMGIAIGFALYGLGRLLGPTVVPGIL
ncbi:hypothetical protein [Micromonospora sp. NBC_01796]|uniref:hypothetical protein n=1 Tax=Micromonospora sp. NBC_01796 TaxID=2975987 RepID=UPI002DDBD04E|nr:hypothetical protein [Micromonospora sp. NBC_01796]WSA88823.1 hypothetical protein OIE47_15120 [Micromonospora sp. NBC_01796]